jgi:hypothetical protein
MRNGDVGQRGDPDGIFATWLDMRDSPARALNASLPMRRTCPKPIKAVGEGGQLSSFVWRASERQECVLARCG